MIKISHMLRNLKKRAHLSLFSNIYIYLQLYFLKTNKLDLIFYAFVPQLQWKRFETPRIKEIKAKLKKI